MAAHSTRFGALPRSELEKIITEACLGDVDEYIARRYLIGKIPHIEIAGELETIYGVHMDRSTVSRHWAQARDKLVSPTR